MKLADARRIAVLRALKLGDLLCLTPALRALRAAAPAARIILIGLPWAHEFAARYSAYIDDFLEFPGYPGLPERDFDPVRFTAFLAQARAIGFDLALQLHGSGRIVNALTARLGARYNAGFTEPGAYCPDPERFLPWERGEHEVMRYLRLLEHLGAPARGKQLDFPLTAADQADLAAALGPIELPPGKYICVHPGAQWRSRRWPVERFARTADALARLGYRIVLTGAAAERDLTRRVAAAMRRPCLDLAGKTSLGAVARLLRDARLLLSNDTGVSHIAAAVRTPSVVICNGADPGRWAPLDRDRHRTLHHPVECRPCGHVDCPFPSHPCAVGVTVEAVVQTAVSLLGVQPALALARRETTPLAEADRFDAATVAMERPTHATA